MGALIILTEPTLKFLLKGRVITVDVTKPYRKGRTYAVGTSHKRSTCRAVIVSVAANGDGWKLQIRQQTLEEPRLLAANPAAMRADYTHDPARAAKGEPEALTDDQLKDVRLHSAQNGVRHRADIEKQLGELTAAQRLARLEDAQKRIRVDIGSELRMIGSRIERAEKRLRK